MIDIRHGKIDEEKVTEDIEVLKLRKLSLQKNRVETMYQIRNGLIVILNMISFVGQILLNHCVWRLKRK